jgi:hypothetical protein
VFSFIHACIGQSGSGFFPHAVLASPIAFAALGAGLAVACDALAEGALADAAALGVEFVFDGAAEGIVGADADAAGSGFGAGSLFEQAATLDVMSAIERSEKIRPAIRPTIRGSMRVFTGT